MKLHEIRYIPSLDSDNLTPAEIKKKELRMALSNAELRGPNAEVITDDNGITNVKDGDICFSNMKWRHLPENLNFHRVDGSFILNKCYLSSWAGCPDEIGENLEVNDCRFEDMYGSPSRVNGSIKINNCRLKTLEGMTDGEIERFECNDNDLTNLIGGPQSVLGDYKCSNNQLTSLEGIASHVDGGIYGDGNFHLETFKNIGDMISHCKGIFFRDSVITSCVLGLLQIEGLMPGAINFKPMAACNIVRKYIGKKNSIFECQQELIDAGFEELAQL